MTSEIKASSQKIIEFFRKYDELHLSLACHAAFPLVLTPELLYQIWAEFVGEAPWVSVAHLLLSPLCREVSYEVFEMELSVRDLLLEELEARYGRERLEKLADFMLDYVKQCLTGYDANTVNLKERHVLVSLAYTRPNEAARELARKLSAGVKAIDVREAFRWTTLGKTLATPLKKAGLQPLLTYNDLLFHYARGEIHQHPELINTFGREREQLERRLAIGPLKVPSDVNIPTIGPVSVGAEFSPPSSWGGDYYKNLEKDLQTFDEKDLQTFDIEVATLTVEPVGAGSSLQKLTFQTVYVDKQGKITKIESREAYYYEEPLGEGIEPLTMLAIPAGEFQMGSPDDEKERYPEASPQHPVSVSAFYLSQTPITQGQWKFIASQPQIARELKPDPSNFKGKDNPVERVSWYDAIEFCARLSRHTGREYRLPSEAEWEYACRAGTTTPFHFGETITGELANYSSSTVYQQEKAKESLGKTTPVRTYSPNAFGLYDMHGNVWEWCLDPWHGDYNGAPTDGSVWDEKNNNDNCYQNLLNNINVLLTNKQNRVLRGGSWVYVPWTCRSAYRYFTVPGFDDDDRGFRVACGLPMTV